MEKMVRKISKNGEKKPSFFKFLFQDWNTEHVRIPKKFLKHISKELSDRAVLKLKCSSDSSWTVRVFKTTKGSVCFKNGWKEFLRDNSLGDNEFLVFSYDGKMHFSVRIFDNNGIARAEKIGSNQNPTFTNSTKRPRGRPRKYPVSSSQRPRPSNPCKDDSGEKISCSKSSELKDVKEEEQDSEDNTSEDLEAAEPETFKSNVSHFICVVRKTYYQYVPRAFSREHFAQGKHFEVILKNAEGKGWRVRAVPGNQSHLLSAGWSEFASANQISIGDTCKFELLGSNKMMVSILK